MGYRFLPIIMLMFCTLVGEAPATAQAPTDVRDLVGVRTSFGESQLKSRDYQLRRTENGRDRRWSYWWNSSIRQCISVVTLNDQFDSIVASPAADCERQGGRDDGSDDNGRDDSSNDRGGLQVTFADWGWGDRRMDVTNRVQSLLSGTGMVTVNVQNMGGDPSKGDDKVLRITARDANGQTQQFSYKEGSSIDTSQFSNSGRQGSGRYRRGRGNRGRGNWGSSQIQIVRASYGTNHRTNDVTQRLIDLVGANNSLSVQITNINMGGDPDRGEDKILTVTYRFNGVEEQTVTVKEGDTLRIP